MKVYSAHYTHATYPIAAQLGRLGGFDSDYTGEGLAWDARDDIVFMDIERPAWMGYVGLWGTEDGDDGPLGPWLQSPWTGDAQ